jgi:hypothetical protein
MFVISKIDWEWRWPAKVRMPSRSRPESLVTPLLSVSCIIIIERGVSTRTPTQRTST